MDATDHQPRTLHRLQRAIDSYSVIWGGMVEEWNSAHNTDAVWLTYSANYLLRTGGVRWALDPYHLGFHYDRLPVPDVAADLAACQVVVLTHAHRDHLDLGLIRALRHAPVTWVIPSFMLEQVQPAAGLPLERVVQPKIGQSLHFGALTLTPFAGLHLAPGHGVPAMGYLAEFSGKRWLFPGDTRVYNRQQLPVFGSLDGGFAHLWLGRGAALQSPPPLVDAFCEFWTELAPHRMVLTHLYEFERPPTDFWDHSHADLVTARMAKLAPDIDVETAVMGYRVEL